MYLDNKYTEWYNSIIDRGISRNLITKKTATASLGYCEKHHITPRSLGGSNNKSNLVYLTAREHFICHWLLTKMVHDDQVGKMMMAINMMKAKTPKQHRYSTGLTSKIFEKYRHLAAKEHSKLMTGRKQSKEHVDKRAKAITGKKHTVERKNNIAAAKTGCTSWNKGKKYKCEAISSATKGVKKAREHIEAAAKARIGQTWWNNGIVQTRAACRPGADYVPGRCRDTTVYVLRHVVLGVVQLTRQELIQNHDLCSGNVSQLLNKKIVSYKGWTLVDL